MKCRGFADKQHSLTPFKVVDFLDAALRKAASGRDVVRMEAGQPGFALPPQVAEAAKTAIDCGVNLYTPALGNPALREAIAGLYDQRYGVTVDPRRILVTTGSTAALGMICDLLLNPGDSMLLPDPGYPCNINFVRRCNAHPIVIPVSAAQNYQLGADDIDRHWREDTAGVIVASPTNPTGDVLSAGELTALHRAVGNRGGHMVVDEIYHGLNYTPEGDTSIVSICDDAFVINSFSKYFGLPGWRLGWAVVPEEAVGPLERMAQNFYISPPSIAQAVGLAALQPPCLEIYDERREIFKARRDFLVPALRSLGFLIDHTPPGAFYIYANTANLAENSESLCWQILESAAVSLTPGTDFGAVGGLEHVRFSYTEELPRLEEAVERIASFLGARREI